MPIQQLAAVGREREAAVSVGRQVEQDLEAAMLTQRWVQHAEAVALAEVAASAPTPFGGLALGELHHQHGPHHAQLHIAFHGLAPVLLAHALPAAVEALAAGPGVSVGEEAPYRVDQEHLRAEGPEAAVGVHAAAGNFAQLQV